MSHSSQALGSLAVVVMVASTAPFAWGQGVQSQLGGERNVQINEVHGNVVIYGSSGGAPLESRDGAVEMRRKQTVYLNPHVSITMGSIQDDRVGVTVKVSGRSGKSGYLRLGQRLAFKYLSNDVPNYAVELVDLTPEIGRGRIKVVKLV